ncbi:MAG: F0F1 ATP synthase subunit A [Phycisphaerae bacterium]
MFDLLLASSDPLQHVVQHNYLDPIALPLPDWLIKPFREFTFLSNHIVMQIVAAILLIAIIPRALRARTMNDEVGRMVPTGLGNAIEGICVALRSNIIQPALGKYTDKFIVYLWTVFFFILTSNMLGIIPLMDWTKPLGRDWHGVGGTATGNIFVTGTLAACTLVMVVYNGLATNGMGYIKHFFMGPPGINILIAVLEMIGLLAKAFALAVRLFANMVAGHVLLAVLLSFIGMAMSGLGTWIGLLFISPLVVAGSVAINVLEIFVAFLQAFIFTFLTTMFIGQAVNIAHDDHEHEHAEHEHGGEEHGAAQAAGHG